MWALGIREGSGPDSEFCFHGILTNWASRLWSDPWAWWHCVFPGLPQCHSGAQLAWGPLDTAVGRIPTRATGMTVSVMLGQLSLLPSDTQAPESLSPLLLSPLLVLLPVSPVMEAQVTTTPSHTTLSFMIPTLLPQFWGKCPGIGTHHGNWNKADASHTEQGSGGNAISQGQSGGTPLSCHSSQKSEVGSFQGTPSHTSRTQTVLSRSR